MRSPIVLLLILLFQLTDLSGQDNQDDKKGELSLNIKSLSFIRNNEYFNPIKVSDFFLSGSLPSHVDKSQWIEGYTLTGFFLQPELVYEPSEKISLRGGVHLLKFSGTGRFSEAIPVFSASLDLSEHTILTLGSLSGSDEHRMFDPHFNRERYYYKYHEDGMQVKTVTTSFFNDVWISWENYIFKADTTREIFTFGESFRYTSPKIGRFTIELPVQLQFKHFGGQISDYPEHVTTFFNFAAGAGFTIDLDSRGFFRTGFDYIQFYNKVIPGRPADIITNGSASWFRFHFDHKGSHLNASFWKANDFYAPNGNGLYASVFDFSSDYVIHDRKLLTLSLEQDFIPESYLKAYFGIELFYDIPGERLDHAITLHIRFDKLFKLF